MNNLIVHEQFGNIRPSASGIISGDVREPYSCNIIDSEKKNLCITAEMPGITPTRGQSFDSHVTERVISQFLAELDGLEELHGVVAIAATNRIDMIDRALLRPGRFDKMVEVPLPDEAAWREILRIYMNNKPFTDDVDVQKLVKETANYSGADIAGIVRESIMLAIREYVQSGKLVDDDEEMQKYRVTGNHIKKAREKVKPEKERDIGIYT
ncbi:MAG: AAA family ATPase [ANME-2 cluster archaeon]|nr:AAA family ATPase [ANME-2 cluster archaeon]MBC2700770.1 AAA family ATPase [ANME-2 cluster archaeon]MBC2709015.1 AAA family ATPase [ANME-2 cluster archaeon]MBC2747275.1 AAA family ATPase [ANME-2 cluster archaeon]MBC2764326.1 AAA family ATPase [ANME-2 cluster archaeon]